VSTTIAVLLSLVAKAHGTVAPAPSPDVEQPPPPAEPQSPRWIDPRDGCVDLASFIEHPADFLPLVVPITEPALGYGAVVAAVLLDPREHAGSAGWARPNVTVVGGMLTEDGSEGLFAANSTLWGDGDIQTLVGVGSFGLELGLYGIGADPSLSGAALDDRLDADGALAEMRRRFGDSWH